MQLTELILRNNTVVLSTYLTALGLALIYLNLRYSGSFVLGVATSGYALAFVFHLAYVIKLNEKKLK